MKRKQQQWNKNYDSGCSSNRKRKQSHRLINISLSISLGVHPCRTSTHTRSLIRSYHHNTMQFMWKALTTCIFRTLPTFIRTRIYMQCGYPCIRVYFLHLCTHPYLAVYGVQSCIMYGLIFIYRDICVHVCMRLMHVLFTKRDHMPNCISKSQKWIALSWAELSCNI